MEEKDSLKKLGIWMDHAQAHVIEYNEEGNRTNAETISNMHQVDSSGSNQGEKMKHNKEQQDQKTYYKIIADQILPYDEVLLFGPTEAKSELLNILKADHHYDQKKLHIQQADKMTENQQQAFVYDFFSSPVD